MKTSYKMRKTIERLMKKYSFTEEEVTYGVEPIEENRHGNGYYDFADLTSSSPSVRLHFTVAFDGTYHR